MKLKVSVEIIVNTNVDCCKGEKVRELEEHSENSIVSRKELNVHQWQEAVTRLVAGSNCMVTSTDDKF